MATTERTRLALCEPFALAGFRVDPGLNEISRDDEVHHLEPKAMSVLCLLAANQGQTISREQLFATVWDGRVVVEETLTRAVSQIRHAFGDDTKKPKILQTVPKTGYRLIATVSLIDDSSPVSHSIPIARRFNPLPALLALAAVAITFLVWPYAGTDAPPKNSLAVLPFVNMSGDESEEYLSDGMTEEILNSLARIEGIKLVGRTSTFQYKNQRLDLREVGKELGVENVLEGSVRRSGNRVRTTVQLVNAKDGYHIWSQVYDREFSDTFEVQQAIADAVAGKLELKSGQPYTASERTDNLDAYTWYLKGTKLARDTDFERAASAYHKAIELDPHFAPPYSRYVWACLARWGVPISQECRDRVEPYMARAQQLTPQSADVDVGYALIYDILHKDYEASRHALERALERDPDNTFALMNHAYGLTVTWGEDELATQFHARVFHLEPLSFGTRITYSRALAHLGRVGEAESELEKLTQMLPDYAVPYMSLAELKLRARPPDYAQGFRLTHEAMRRNSEAMPFTAIEALIDLQDYRAAEYWVDRIAEAIPGTYYALLIQFKLNYARGDDENAYWLSRQLATVDTQSTDLEWNTLGSVAWLRYLQSRDQDLALGAYVQMYPQFADENPAIGEWNYAAAIGLAALLDQQGNITDAARLLDKVSAYLDKHGYDHAQARAAISVLRGDLDSALRILTTAVARGDRYAWWLLERDELFTPLRQDPVFEENLRIVKADMARRYQDLRKNGELPLIPVSTAALPRAERPGF